ncbi:hypothetical protein [Helicobacter marmotae]|nr:hypothetical protein [Helicobacter marmotae]
MGWAGDAGDECGIVSESLGLKPKIFNTSLRLLLSIISTLCVNVFCKFS